MDKCLVEVDQCLCIAVPWVYVCGSGAVTDMWEVFTQQLDMTFVSLGTFAVHGPHIKLFGDKGMEWIQAPCME